MPDRLVVRGRALVAAAGGGCPAVSRRVRGLGSHICAAWRQFTRARGSSFATGRARPLRFGGPDGAVVGARRDAWRSDGVLRDGYCDSCWSDLQTAAPRNGRGRGSVALCGAKHTRITAFRTSRATHIEAPYSSTRAQQAASSNVAATLRTLHICPAASQAATALDHGRPRRQEEVQKTQK